MKNDEAREIIKCLADGIDPVTGEMFEEGSPYTHPQIIRALYTTLDIFNQQTIQMKRKKILPNNAGQSWTKEEDLALLNAYDNDVATKELAVLHERTEGAISSRLMRLGRLQKYG